MRDIELPWLTYHEAQALWLLWRSGSIRADPQTSQQLLHLFGSTFVQPWIVRTYSHLHMLTIHIQYLHHLRKVGKLKWLYLFILKSNAQMWKRLLQAQITYQNNPFLLHTLLKSLGVSSRSTLYAAARQAPVLVIQ